MFLKLCHRYISGSRGNHIPMIPSAYDCLCAIFWTRLGSLTCISKTDYPLGEREASWILGRDSSRLFSTSTGLIMALPRPCAWEMLPRPSLVSPPLPTRERRSLLSHSFVRAPDRIRTIPLSPLSIGRTFEFVFVNGMSAEAFPLSTFSLSLYLSSWSAPF